MDSPDRGWLDYCSNLFSDEDFKGNLRNLKEASNSMDIPENFLIELATHAPDNCLNEINLLKRCVQKRQSAKSGKWKVFSSTRRILCSCKLFFFSEKIKINTFKTSEVENSNNSSGKINCISDIINVEKCIIEKNRYHPCPPAYCDLSKLQKLDNKFKKNLAKMLRTDGIEVVEETTTNGELHLNIVECSKNFKKYNSLISNYSNYFPPPNGSPDLFSSVLSPLDSILILYRNIGFPLRPRKVFVEAVKDALYKREILNIDDTMERIMYTERNYMEPVGELETYYVEFNKNFRNLLEKFPNQEKCVDGKQHRAFIRNKFNFVKESRIINDWDRLLENSYPKPDLPLGFF